MGNCAFTGNEELSGHESIVRVVTADGGIMELHPPVTAECVTNGFPCHGIYRGTIASTPLLHNEELVGGETYYLRPVNNEPRFAVMPSAVAPYRVSLDQHGCWRRQELDQVMQGGYGYGGGGIDNGGLMWKVKLVICPDELKAILSKESRTEELIESVRTVAKCGVSGLPSSASSVAGSSVASSEHWSLASSRKES